MNQLIQLQPPLLVHYLLRWEIMEQFLPRLVEPHGLLGLLEQRKNSGEVPTETVPWWWWVFLEQFSLHQMEQLGLLGLLEQQTISGTSPTETVPLWQ